MYFMVCPVIIRSCAFQVQLKGKQVTNSNWAKALFTVTSPEGAGRQIVVQGRYRWALESLMQAGVKGCTPLDHVGPRWSAYVHVLRHRYGLNVETITEAHDGPFSGTHARYVLRCNVTKGASN